MRRPERPKGPKRQCGCTHSCTPRSTAHYSRQETDLNGNTASYEYKQVSNMATKAAWDNHFSAFGAQDLGKILLDYTEQSEVIVWDTNTGTRSDFKGLAGVRNLFTGLFAKLSDLSTLAAPLIEVQESSGMVFLVWECPGCGYEKVTDTFIFKNGKILRQNIVVFSAKKLCCF